MGEGARNVRNFNKTIIYTEKELMRSTHRQKGNAFQVCAWHSVCVWSVNTVN